MTAAKPTLRLPIDSHEYAVSTSLTRYTLTGQDERPITVDMDGRCSRCGFGDGRGSASGPNGCQHSRRLAQVGLLPERFLPREEEG